MRIYLDNCCYNRPFDDQSLWEQLHNPNFNMVEFDQFRNETGTNSFVQLICISNMENINAVMINDGLPQPKRLKKLNEIAIQQMRILSEVEGRKLLILIYVMG